MCKRWLLENNTLQTDDTSSKLAAYLAALSESITGARAAKRRINLLNLVNDLLHHTKYHGQYGQQHERLISSLNLHLPTIVGCAAAYPRASHAELHRRLDKLLSLWEREGYFSAGFMQKLRDAAVNAEKATASDAVQARVDGGSQRTKEEPYIMPALHGDPSIMFWDWPAANMIPYLLSDTQRPIHSSGMKLLRLKAGPADEKMVNAVKDLLKESDRLYDPTYAADAEVEGYDRMGQALIRDKEANKLIPRETYYGWSVDFCKRMKAKQTEFAQRQREQERERARELARDRSRQRGRSTSQQRHGKYSSGSQSRSLSRDRGRDYNRNNSKSRSQSRSRYRSRSYSPSSSRSRSRIGQRDASGRSRLNSRSPNRHDQYNQAAQAQQAPTNINQTYHPPPPPHLPPHLPPHPPIAGFPFIPPPPGQGFPPNFAIPPPPPGHAGSWPPHPPPPPMPPNMNMQGGFPPFTGPPVMPVQNMPNFQGAPGYGGYGGAHQPSGPGGYRNQNSQWNGQQNWNGQGNYGGGRGNWQPNQFGRGRGRGNRY